MFVLLHRTCLSQYLINRLPPPQKHHAARHHKKRGRGLFDMAKQGLALSNSLGVGNKLASHSDPRIAMAGKLLKLAGGRKHRRHHHRRR